MKYAGPASLSFPLKLMEILDSEDLSPIVSWLPDGKGFTIHDKKRFANEILPQHFKVAKFTSFTRRMNRWKFTLQKLGNHKSNYYHQLFLRGQVSKCLEMRPKPQTVTLRRRGLMINHQAVAKKPFATSNSLVHQRKAFDVPNFRSNGSNRSNRNLLSVSWNIPNDTQHSAQSAFTAHPMTSSDNEFPPECHENMNQLHLPSLGEFRHSNGHLPEPPRAEYHHATLRNADSMTTERGVTWNPYDINRPSLPSMHQRMIQNQFHRESYAEDLEESFTHHRAFLERQREFSRVACMNARRAYPINIAPNFDDQTKGLPWSSQTL